MLPQEKQNPRLFNNTWCSICKSLFTLNVMFAPLAKKRVYIKWRGRTLILKTYSCVYTRIPVWLALFTSKSSLPTRRSFFPFPSASAIVIEETLSPVTVQNLQQAWESCSIHTVSEMFLVVRRADLRHKNGISNRMGGRVDYQPTKKRWRSSCYTWSDAKDIRNKTCTRRRCAGLGLDETGAS